MRPASAAVRPMRRRHCAFSPRPTASRPTIRTSIAAARVDRRRRAGLPRSAPAHHARHRRSTVGAACAAGAAGGTGQSRCGAADQGGLRRAGRLRPAAACRPRRRGDRQARRPRRDCCSLSPRKRTIWKLPAIALPPIDRRRAGSVARPRRLQRLRACPARARPASRFLARRLPRGKRRKPSTTTSALVGAGERARVASLRAEETRRVE